MSDDLQVEIEKMRARAPYMAELPKDPAADGMVLIALSPEDWKERAEAIAKLERERASVVEEKTDTARRYTAKIKVLDEAIARLADEIETREKWVDPQQPLQLAEAKQSRRSVQRGTQDIGAPVAQPAEP